ncbi:hypothetical protein GA707_13865 [Nostocoides sp. F2B08]|uniref:hypothetical protein n=1 Tax=Nostocoides sp. F2B08 TaxID=2653936 RepID=UPI001263AD22|nr:hypothetical protein [Tetrasphaera sp. F2B08]KAB7743204.1 hypothetical protein GA707_13865 [Tetrasphaera sp. F2B08]
MTTTLTKLTIRLRQRAAAVAAQERGDIPGWVMVTLMTAAIVAAVWALAEPALTRLFNDAIDDVSR